MHWCSPQAIFSRRICANSGSPGNTGIPHSRDGSARLAADNLPESMSLVRRAIPFFIALVFVAPGQAATKPEPPPAPTNLHGFLLRADEPESLKRDVFPRTPSFTWNPVPGVTKYEFELSASKRFIESAQVWAGEVAGTPAVSVPLALPWMTGRPYALYARVRTVSSTGRSSWSDPVFGFNMLPEEAPGQAPSYPGLVRWTPVKGATSYQVWWTDLRKQISTLTNSADEREFYTFHQTGSMPSVVRWRVRAVRSVYGGLPNGLPAVSYGAWSPEFTSVNPPFQISGADAPSTVSVTVNATFDQTETHQQTPAFLFGGTPMLSGFTGELYRVYVSTDSTCLNPVFVSAIVGGPAYSPRTSGPLALPHSVSTVDKARNEYLRDGVEGATAMYDMTKVLANEEQVATTSSSSPSESEPSPEPQPSGPPTSSTGFVLPQAKGALVDLWDIGAPTGSYWWTVVPVHLVEDYIRDENGKETKTWIYRDGDLPQGTCSNLGARSFTKESEPALISENAAAPYVSGLTTDGHIVSARQEKPVFYGTPLVAWNPAVGAAAYEVQWSKSQYPWSTEGTVFTFGTSALLQDSKGKSLAPGDWFYRARGLNPFFASPIKIMSWSAEVPIVVAKPIFKVLKGAPEKKKTKESAATFRTYPESGFAVAVPTQWKRDKTNPFAKFYLAKGALEGLSTGKTSLRFMAHDPADKSRTTGVSVSSIPTRRHGHETWVKAVKATVAKQKRLVGKPFCVESSLPTGPTLKCAYSFRVANTKLVESEVSYWFDRVDRTYVLALGNVRTANQAKASLRLVIAKRFQISS